MCEGKDEVWMLDRIREWLRQGCVIQAADTGKPILYKLQQGEWYTGLRVAWPETTKEVEGGEDKVDYGVILVTADSPIRS